MRKVLWFAATAAMFVLPAGQAFAQDGQAQQTQKPDQQAVAPAPAPAQAGPAQPQDSLAAAARKAREQKKDTAKTGKVFDNDNIPSTGGVSTVGAAPAQPGDAAAGSANGAAPAASGNDEKAWRAKFAALHHKLEQDEAELDILQRELGVSNVQFYTDPMKGMQQGLTRDEINKKTAGIEAKKKMIEADKQAITDAEDDLRKAGGDSGWAR